MTKKSILVIFGKELPKKNKSWFERFDQVLSQKELGEFLSPGSVQEANELLVKLPGLTTLEGKTLSKLAIYKDYELWWMHYDDIYYQFCLPYTEYRKLLEHLISFREVYLYEPPWPDLFSYYLKAHNCRCHFFKKFKFKNLLPLPAGVVLQILLSFIFLPWLLLKRPGVMVFTSDKFAPPHKCDFRMAFIYEELEKNKTSFVEFIRSMESWPVVLAHAFTRKRPVIYSTAIIEFLHRLTSFFYPAYLPKPADQDSQNYFWFLAATHYLRNVKGTIFSIRAMKFILRLIGVKAAIISNACNRTIHEVLGCKLNNLQTVGIQHGLATRHYFVSDFMPGFNGLPAGRQGKKYLSVDKYGLWSEWWRDYYLKNSQAYRPEQLFVSGPMRPLEKEQEQVIHETKKGKPAALFISEQLADPEEVMPYLLTFLEINDFELYLKFRPYRDGFEEWLKQERPEILKKIEEKAKILRGAMQKAIGQCDVVVGSHSTAVLEALLLLKPFVFFRTKKWGDYFDIKAAGLHSFFSETPDGLIERIKKSREIPKDDLKKLQERFFGNPYQNGSKWVVDQAEKFSKYETK